MSIENSFDAEPNLNQTEKVALQFKNLREFEADEGTFESLEQILESKGFNLANQQEVSNILNDNSLLCRSEQFSKILNLIEGKEILKVDSNEEANMCKMSSGNGYKTAMTEGFSGSDVGHHVKSVLTFEGHNINTNALDKDDSLWDTKPSTAEVSIIGEGTVDKDDVRMVSFRFPINYYPEDFLTDKELELLETEQIKFIVRHYTKEKSVH